MREGEERTRAAARRTTGLLWSGNESRWSSSLRLAQLSSCSQSFSASISASSSAQEIQNARTVHRDLLSHYKLEEGDLGAPPLLLLDLLSGGSMPFSVPGAAWDSLEPSRD